MAYCHITWNGQTFTTNVIVIRADATEDLCFKRAALLRLIYNYTRDRN